MKDRRTVKVLLLVLAMLAWSLSGCGDEDGEATVQPQPTPVPGVEEVLLRVGETHTIELESNPTTGYQWRVSVPNNYLVLVDQKYETDSDLVGAGGVESFTFEAIARGFFETSFEYVRPWEEGVERSRRYVFNIGVSAELLDLMTEAEARAIAETGLCAELGPPGGRAVFNDWTGTWWIDIDVQVENALPACVVDVETGLAEVNMRATGALPPP